MIKILLVFVVVVGFLYVGFGIANYYKKRKDFFSGLVLLCDKIRAEIDFSGKNLLAIFQGLKLEGCPNKLCSNFCDYLKNKNIEFSSKQLFRGIVILKEDEKNIIFDFFSRLGRHDCDNELKLIDDFKNIIFPLSQTCQQDNNKYGKMSIKISFLLGLMLAILII